MAEAEISLEIRPNSLQWLLTRLPPTPRSPRMCRRRSKSCLLLPLLWLLLSQSAQQVSRRCRSSQTKLRLLKKLKSRPLRRRRRRRRRRRLPLLRSRSQSPMSERHTPTCSRRPRLGLSRLQLWPDHRTFHRPALGRPAALLLLLVTLRRQLHLRRLRRPFSKKRFEAVGLGAEEMLEAGRMWPEAGRIGIGMYQ
jgi:hypothetical protein